jgi:hypothetical protein
MWWTKHLDKAQRFFDFEEANRIALNAGFPKVTAAIHIDAAAHL